MTTATAAKRDFSERLKATPTEPGVYLMKSADDGVLYVGKAASLRNRLRSYFASGSGLEPKIRTMVGHVVDFDFIVTESDSEALILENTLIKRHKPPYNARLKDDKSYPFIKIDLSEDFPLVYITRHVANDGGRYFGPYASAKSVRKTLALLKKLFPYRSCTKEITGTDPRPCLDFHLNRCVGPCIGAASKEQYAEIIDQVILFLEGKSEKVTRALSRRMRDAAEALEFERAAALRDQVRAIDRVNEGQKVARLSSENLDVIAAAPGDDDAWVEVFFVRQGKLIGRDNFTMAGTAQEAPEQILGAFVKQFYNANPYIPSRILVEHELEDIEAIQPWIEAKRDGPVKILVPQRGEKRKLVRMVAANAEQGLAQRRVKRTADADLDAAMAELQEALSLPDLPKRIECYDISNIQGTNPVGSMVVFEDGKSRNQHYRRFKINAVEGIDDYAMMREVLTRRFKRMAKDVQEASSNGGAPSEKTSDGAWATVPNLVLIDGGKGHLGAALQVFLDLGIDFIPLASLAKENEELFVPQSPEPIILPRDSKALYLVQRARDEAHRFAITFHRQRRSKGSVRSAMDSVPGIGPKRRRTLLRRFGSVKGIRDAPLDEIAAVPGMTLKLARALKENL